MPGTTQKPAEAAASAAFALRRPLNAGRGLHAGRPRGRGRLGAAVDLGTRAPELPRLQTGDAEEEDARSRVEAGRGAGTRHRAGGASEEGRFARRGRRPATRRGGGSTFSRPAGYFLRSRRVPEIKHPTRVPRGPPCRRLVPGVRGSSSAPSHPWPARRGVKTVTRPLQTGTWRLQSGGAGWRGPRHSVPPLHALTRGRRAPSAARGAFTLPWAPATRGREGGVRGLRSSSYLGTQERNLVPRKTTLESQPEVGGRPPSRRRRARLPLLAGGAPKWGPRGASSASLCAFCPLSLKTSACEGARDVRCERLWRHLSGGAWGPGSGPRTQTARAKAAAGYRGACSDSPQLAVGDVG
ncbi:uncharacterized protein LOC107518874 [Rousettus aegyptiacus]|uniref:uncharacterized protein LOC107518874 n=1 Tax=Rousettus aegyptiacus TaxID=9407 RepID=UPI00168D2177|nr:uncharacterized protein LOC107518874 [Rousettus aegyptiacus]XP_036086482.1 uncharacterized protein LOC107518874 [Rousettus aegyptiacus]